MLNRLIVSSVYLTLMCGYQICELRFFRTDVGPMSIIYFYKDCCSKDFLLNFNELCFVIPNSKHRVTSSSITQILKMMHE